MHRSRSLRILATMILLATSFAAAAAAEASKEEPRLSLEALFLADPFLVEGTGGFSEDNVYGLRPTYRLSERWALEGALNYYNSSGFGDYETTYLDLSARYSFKKTRRFDYFAFGGPTVLRSSFRSFSTGEKETDERSEVHFGLGFELGLSQRFFLRPDLIAHTTDFELDGAPFDIALGFGYRF